MIQGIFMAALVFLLLSFSTTIRISSEVRKETRWLYSFSQSTRRNIQPTWNSRATATKAIRAMELLLGCFLIRFMDLSPFLSFII